jgi:Nif-specific regulatory protein
LAYLSQEETIDGPDLGLLLGADGISPTSDQHAAGSSSAASQELPLAQATDLFQIEHIKQAISRARGNMSEAAELLGLHRSNLYRKMRQLGLATDEP